MARREYDHFRVHKSPTGNRVDKLVDEIQNRIDTTGVEESRFIGPNGKVTRDRIILEGAKLIRAKMNNNNLDL